MRTRHLFFTLVLAALMAIPQGIVAQKPAASTESEAKDVSYTLGKKIMVGLIFPDCTACVAADC